MKPRAKNGKEIMVYGTCGSRMRWALTTDGLLTIHDSVEAVGKHIIVSWGNERRFVLVKHYSVWSKAH